MLKKETETSKVKKFKKLKICRDDACKSKGTRHEKGKKQDEMMLAKVKEQDLKKERNKKR